MTEKTEAAARWLAEQREHPQQVIHLLRDKFGITAVQAAQACTLANQYRMNRSALG